MKILNSQQETQSSYLILPGKQQVPLLLSCSVLIETFLSDCYVVDPDLLLSAQILGHDLYFRLRSKLHA